MKKYDYIYLTNKGFETVNNFWQTKVQGNREIIILLKDHGLLMDILSVMDDEKGFV